MKAPRWPGVEEVLRPTQDDPDDRSRRYALSKLCNAYLVLELHRRLASGAEAAPRGVGVDLFEPGFVPGTRLARDQPTLAGWLFRWLLPGLRSVMPEAHSGVTAAGAWLTWQPIRGARMRRAGYSVWLSEPATWRWWSGRSI